MLAMIILVLELLKFAVTLNSFTQFPSFTNFLFTTVSYHSSSRRSLATGICCCSSSSLTAAGCSSSSASFSTMSFNCSGCPYPIFSIILLHNKESVPRTSCSLYASASRVAVTGVDAALYNLEILFLKNEFIVYFMFLRNFLKILWTSDTLTRLHQHMLPQFCCIALLILGHAPIPPP